MNGTRAPNGGRNETCPAPEVATDLWDAHSEDDSAPPHRNAPLPDAECLHGLIGDIARAGSDRTETNAYAIAANFIAYLSCGVGRGVFPTASVTWRTDLRKRIVFERSSSSCWGLVNVEPVMRGPMGGAFRLGRAGIARRMAQNATYLVT